MTSSRLMGWSNNMAEPKRTNRFELLLEDDLRLTCHSVSLPGIHVDKVEIDRMHNKYYVSGSKVTYDTVAVEFYDFVDNKASTALKAWYSKIYDQGTSLMGYPVDYKRDLLLVIYGPDGNPIETWTLIGSWPTEITRPGLNWKEGNATISLKATLQIDEAVLVLN